MTLRCAPLRATPELIFEPPQYAFAALYERGAGPRRFIIALASG